MRTVYVRIGHDYNAVVAEFAFVEVFLYAATERGYHGFYFFVFQSAVDSDFLHVKNLQTPNTKAKPKANFALRM